MAYLIGAAPQPRSVFTYDEIAELQKRIELIKAGVVAAPGEEPDWLTSGPASSIRGMAAVARQLARHPVALSRALSALVMHSILVPRDLAVAIRATLAACVLHEAAKPDLIHAQFAGPAAAAAYVWSALAGVPWTVRAHAYDVYKPYRWAAVALRDADRVFAISRHARRHLEDRMKIRAEVLHVGIAPAMVPQRQPRAATAPYRFISVGALAPKKGHHRAIAAIHYLATMGRRVELDIYGDGPLNTVLAKASVGPAAVRLLGHLPGDEVRAAYQHYDGFILTPMRAGDGDEDGIPVVLMEAMAAGLPVFCTNAGGIRELLVDGVTGTVLPEDPAEMAAVMNDRLGDYRVLLNFTVAAGALVRAEFNLEEVTARLVAEWAAVMDEVSPPDRDDMK